MDCPTPNRDLEAAERLALMNKRPEPRGMCADAYRDAQDAVWSMSPDERAAFFEWFVKNARPGRKGMLNDLRGVSLQGNRVHIDFKYGQVTLRQSDANRLVASIQSILA